MGRYQGSRATSTPSKAKSSKPTAKGGKKLPGRAAPIIAIALVTVIAALAIYIATPPAHVDRPSPTTPTDPTTDSAGLAGTTSPSSTDAMQTTAAATDPPLERKPLGSFYTFLLLGTHDDYNTDTIMLASLDMTDKANPKVDIISIPRDSQVDVPSSIKRINGIYGANGGGEKGAKAMMEEIEEICGVYPDFYAVVNIASFTKIVDLVNGVPFYVPYDMKHDKPDKDPDKQYFIDLPKGQHTLDSETALAVVRYRGTGRSDWGRMDIQKDFLIALLKRVKNQFSLDKIPGMIDIVAGSIKTNMPAKDMLWFYTNCVAKMSLDEDIALHSMPDLGSGKYDSGKYGRQDYVFLDREGIVELVNKTVNPYTTDIKPEMLNIIRLEN